MVELDKEAAEILDRISSLLENASAYSKGKKMKAGWERKKLGDLLEIQNGFAFDSKSFSDSGEMPLIRIRDLKKGIDTEIRYTGEFDEKYIVNAGDLLVGMDGEFRCYEWKGKQALLNQRVCRLQKFKDSLFDRFVFYGINKYLKDIEESTGFTTVKHLSSKKISDINFPIPPLSEQRRIVAILDEAFAGIAAAKEKAEQNLKNAKEVFESYLESVFTPRGADWKELTLKEISSDFGRGKSKHRPRNDKKLYGGDYPFIQTGDIRSANHLIIDYSQTYNETGLAQSKLWPKGTICITIAANIAETAILNFDACFPDSVIGIVVNDNKADSDYVEFLLQAFKVKIQAMSKGSAQENINLGTFENKLFPFPTVYKQKKIVERLTYLHQETSSLESSYQQKIYDLEELKKSVLQQAFSGAL